jgi:hypothetical protein
LNPRNRWQHKPGVERKRNPKGQLWVSDGALEVGGGVIVIRSKPMADTVRLSYPLSPVSRARNRLRSNLGSASRQPRIYALVRSAGFRP